MTDIIELENFYITFNSDIIYIFHYQTRLYIVTSYFSDDQTIDGIILFFINIIIMFSYLFINYN